MDEGQTSSFCLTGGHMSFEECRIGDKAPKIERSSCSPRRHCERWFWILCSIHWTRIISITNDGSKSHGYHLQTAWLRKTSSWRSICLYPGKSGGCTQIVENSQIGVSSHMDSSTTTQMAKIMVQYGRHKSFLLNEICTVILWQDYFGKAIWENPIGIQLGESFQLRMLFLYTVKRITLISVCGWHQIGWKETKY